MLCQEAAGLPPVILGLDGDGSVDGRPSMAAHRIATSLIIHGENLTGASVDLSAQGSGPSYAALSPAPTSSDARLDLILPVGFLPGEYIVRVANAAGEDQTAATVLQGEDGTAITGAEIVAKINEARGGGTLLVADRLGSSSETALLGEIADVGGRVTALESALANLPASPNLLLDTLEFRGLPVGPATLTASTSFGAWGYYVYGSSGSTVAVEDAPADLMTALSGGSTWWQHPVKVLHVNFAATGPGPGRILQRALASEKRGPMTMTAWVKVLAGTLSVGQEGRWQAFSPSSWQRVGVTDDSPDPTLGGAYGIAGADGVHSEALVALIKLERGSVVTPYIEAQTPLSWYDQQTIAAPTGSLTSATYTAIAGKPVTVAARGPVRLDWSLSAFSGSGAGDWWIRTCLGSACTPEVQCYTNEASSHKGCSGTAVVDADAGAQNAEVQVRVQAGTFNQDSNDRIQWTATLLR
jgi:hypothetical protein